MKQLFDLPSGGIRGFSPTEKFSWPLVPMASVVNLHYGRALVEGRRRPGQVPVYGTNGPTGWHDESISAGPTVILGRKGMGNLGIEWCDGPFWVIDTAYYTTFDEASVFPRFFYFFSKFVGLNHLKDGTSNPSLSRDVFARQWFPCPPLAEQVEIAAILGALDDKIALNRRMNETLEAMARAIFKDWFVDFGPTRAKMEGRAPHLVPELWALFPDRLDDEDKPEGWRLSVLQEILDELETGGRPKGGVSGYTSGVPSVGAESIVGLGVFDYQKTKYIPKEFFEAMNKGHVKSRDVLLYKDGGRPGEFEPHLTIFGDGFPFDEFAINEHVYRLRAKSDFGQALLYFWLSSDQIMEEMRIKGTGVAIPGLNSTQVKSLSALIPSSRVARAFNLLVDPLVTRVLANCNEARTLAKTRDFLLPKLMSGEIRVREAKKIVEAAQ